MERPVRLTLALLLTLLALLPTLTPTRLYAQVQEGATLTVLRGQVAVIRTDGSAVQPAPSGTLVSAGDEIRTLTRTGALITFFAGTEIEMGEETILVVERVSIGGGKVDISLKQVLGTTLNRVQSLTDPNSTYRIDAGGATAIVRGTTFLLIGPVTTSSGNIAAIVCMEDCDGRTTFAGCAVAPYAAFGVTVSNNRPSSECATTAVSRGADYFNAAFEVVTAFEQTFASDRDNINPGVGNLGREAGQRRADERRLQEDRDDQPPPPPVPSPPPVHQPVAQTAPAVTLPGCLPGGPPPPVGPPTLFPLFGSVVEGNAGTVVLNVPVYLLPASTVPVTVNYTTADATATAPGDYLPASGTLTFPPGSTVQNVPITVNGDVLPEFDELIAVNFSSPVGAPLSFASSFGRIADDDTPIQVTVLPTSVFEGNAGATNLVHTVTLSRTSPTPLTVDYASIPGGTASVGIDYQPAPTTPLIIPANTLSATFNVTVFGDTAPEPDETAFVQISNPSGGAVIGGSGVAIGTILDDDGPPRVAITSNSVHEGCAGTTALAFSVDLSTPSASPVTVNFATANGTATAPGDYQSATGTVTFAPGITHQEIVVQVVGDTTQEPDETFTVTLSGASPGVTIVTPTATGTIINDD